jgi:hypothetical protein
MKRFGAVLVSVVVIIALASVVFAGEIQKGTIKGVDIKSGTITFCPEGTTDNITLKADKSLDISKVKPDTKAEVTLDKETVKGIREIKKPKPAIGC